MLPFGLLTSDGALVNVRYHSKLQLAVSHPTVNCDNMNDLSHTELYLPWARRRLSSRTCVYCLYRSVLWSLSTCLMSDLECDVCSALLIQCFGKHVTDLAF